MSTGGDLIDQRVVVLFNADDNGDGGNWEPGVVTEYSSKRNGGSVVRHVKILYDSDQTTSKWLNVAVELEAGQLKLVDSKNALVPAPLPAQAPAAAAGKRPSPHPGGPVVGGGRIL